MGPKGKRGLRRGIPVLRPKKKPKNQAIVDRITELEAALEKYGMHLDTCPWGGARIPSTTDERPFECTCGLEQALEGGLVGQENKRESKSS
jgi:hypothetical protein